MYVRSHYSQNDKTIKWVFINTGKWYGHLTRSTLRLEIWQRRQLHTNIFQQMMPSLKNADSFMNGTQEPFSNTFLKESFLESTWTAYQKIQITFLSPNLLGCKTTTSDHMPTYVSHCLSLLAQNLASRAVWIQQKERQKQGVIKGLENCFLSLSIALLERLFKISYSGFV